MADIELDPEQVQHLLESQAEDIEARAESALDRDARRQLEASMLPVVVRPFTPSSFVYNLGSRLFAHYSMRGEGWSDNQSIDAATYAYGVSMWEWLQYEGLWPAGRLSPTDTAGSLELACHLICGDKHHRLCPNR